jgi:homoserine O-succinyltransferase
MPLLLDTIGSGSARDAGADDCVTIALVNNMPDPALDATERQFGALLAASAGDIAVRLLLFSIAEVPRSDYMRGELAGRYRDVSDLWDINLDGLIVTGTEPRAKNLKDEPYWNSLSDVVDWARENTFSTIWSCLAAHAAVLHADGVQRRALPEKMFGVFQCEAAGAHPMIVDAAFGLRVPHSRFNELPEKALKACGYRILTRSALAGVDMFAKQEKSFHLFLQGHPEYEASTLLREYRRDVGRFLRRERETYPALPQAYLGETAAGIAAAFRERATADRRDHLIASFPMGALEAGLRNPWHGCAVGIYQKWLHYLSGCKAERRPRARLSRRVWRDWPAGGARRPADRSSL